MEIINLDVSGQLFRVQKDILLKIPYFNNLFNDCEERPETIFVARPPNIFKHVIGYIIDNLYPYPAKYSFELDFYGIEYNNNKMLPSTETLLMKIDTMNKKIETIYDEYLDYVLNLDKKCRNPNCNTKVLGIYCDYHLKCVYEGCTNKPIDFDNYCEEHDGIGSLCCTQGCKKNKTNKYFCDTH